MALDGSAPAQVRKVRPTALRALRPCPAGGAYFSNGPTVDRPARTHAQENNYANHAKLLSFESMQICKPKTYISTSMHGAHTPPATAPPADVLGSPGHF
jgi:hypothetical protein